MLFQLISAPLVALALTSMVIPLLGRRAERLGLIDHPHDPRKIHNHPKPLVGGIGMALGIVLTLLLFLPGINTYGFLLATSAIVLMGAADDRFDVHFKVRFLIQAGAVLLLYVCCGTGLTSFGNLLGFGELTTGWLALPVTIFCIIGVINAVNMLDGLDGLAGGTSLMAFIAFAALSFIGGNSALLVITLTFTGALIAFLRFNWHPSKLFMGDAGSMMLGFVLGYVSLELTQGPGTSISPSAALLVLALPVTDTITVMVKRVQRGHSPFHPDKTHLHHMLMRLGISHPTAARLIVLASAVTGGLGVAATMLGFSDVQMFALFVTGFTIYFVASYKLASIYSLYRIYIKKEDKPDEVELQLHDAA